MTSTDPSETSVFLHYTQHELDRNFDQRGWITNALETIATYGEESTATRRIHQPRTVRYGTTEDETLDIFVATDTNAPINVFVHGGAWLNFSKDDFSFVAAPLVPAGVTCVVLNFAKLPHVLLADMVAQVRRGIDWICANLVHEGGEVHLSGWSSGAHLAAMALTQLSSGRQAVRSGFFISGPFDLHPVVLSARSSYVKLDRESVRTLSPHHSIEDLNVPIFLAYAGGDTDEFQRQSKAFAQALRMAGKPVILKCFERLNHFELMKTFGTAGSPLVESLLDVIRNGVNSVCRGPSDSVAIEREKKTRDGR